MGIPIWIASRLKRARSIVIQGDSGWKVNILGGDVIGYCEKKTHMNMCLTLNCHRHRTVWIYKYNSVVDDNREREIKYF